MIAKSWLSSCWQWKIGAGVALSGTLTLGVNSVVVAQIVPDNTLGAESSVVTPNVNIQGVQGDRIDNGAIRGANLFHSFEEFSVGARRGAYFSNPAGIENIFSRVTGANRSEILGRLGVLGNANLFLINPRGIVFGPGTSLDVQGSFLATTADAVKLGEAGLFSAELPDTSNLLSVSPSAILFNTIAAQPIVNRSRSPGSIRQPNSAGLFPGLQVQPGRTLALIGGNVLIEGGRLTAAGGRIELSSVAGLGEVSLTSSGNRFVLGYDAINNFGNISLSNGAFVDASGEGGGDVQIQGGRLELAQGSNIWADTLRAENGGEVRVRATEVVLSEGSFLTADVAPTGTGAGGDVTIETERLVVRDGSRVTARTFGAGKGGSLRITADNSVEVIGTSADGRSPSNLMASSQGTGNAGDVSIVTGRLLVGDGAVVSTTTFGAGKGGRLQITALESVELIGTSRNGQLPSGLSATSFGSGDAGDVSIDTGRLLVGDGARVSTTSFGAGNSGSLQITASDSVEVIGTSANNQLLSGLYAQSQGSGSIGNLTINTGRLLVRDGGQVSAGTSGTGKGGSRLQITASESVEVIGASANGQFNSGLFAPSSGSGDAGELKIDTRRLLVRDGAQVAVGTRDEGKGGSLQITASDSVEVIGTSVYGNGTYRSGLFARSDGSGDAGNLTIDTGRLLVRDGAVVTTATRGEGKGGSLQINAADAIELIGTTDDGQFNSGLVATTSGSGNAGNLTIDTQRLLVRDGAVISSASSGDGIAGDINITAKDTLRADDGTIETNTSRSSGGAIAIKAGDIRLFGDSDIISNVASGADDGGAITLTANSILAFDDSDILAFARNGTGGDIALNTPAFFGENYRPAPRNTNPDTLNDNNRVDINATGAVSGIITIPDVSFIQNSLTELPENQINTDNLLASSCIVRRNQQTRGSFTVTGTGGLPQRPGDTQMSSFPTVDVATLPTDSISNTNPHRSWQKGDPIVEPQGVYRLANGKLVLSRECS